MKNGSYYLYNTNNTIYTIHRYPYWRQGLYIYIVDGEKKGAFLHLFSSSLLTVFSNIVQVYFHNQHQYKHTTKNKNIE